MKKSERILGALFGVAVGDALGAPLEFMTEQEIEEQHGYVHDMIGGGWLDVKPGEVTDDTQMTIAVAEGIIDNPRSPVESVGARFIEWAKSKPKDIGATCFKSIARASDNFTVNKPNKHKWREASFSVMKSLNGRSAGNGSLMRTIYPALYYSRMERAADVATDISEMTHADGEVSVVVRDYVRMTFDAVNGAQPEKILWGDRVAQYAFPSVLSPTGYVMDSFLTAVSCLRAAQKEAPERNKFYYAVSKAVNCGGDADTIGAITGGLAGAMWGYGNIPTKWLRALDSDIHHSLIVLAAEAYRA